MTEYIILGAIIVLILIIIFQFNKIYNISFDNQILILQKESTEHENKRLKSELFKLKTALKDETR
jgi:hypothetical protein